MSKRRLTQIIQNRPIKRPGMMGIPYRKVAEERLPSVGWCQRRAEDMICADLQSPSG